MNRQTDFDPEVFARVMALPTSLRHDVLKFLGATSWHVQAEHPSAGSNDTGAADQGHIAKGG